MVGVTKALIEQISTKLEDIRFCGELHTGWGHALNN